MAGFRLGTHSRQELEGVHPHMVQTVELAIQWTPVDFTVHDGLRTLEEQRVLYESKASFTMRSLHLPGAPTEDRPEGWGRAVDLVPWIGGKLRWEWEPIFEIAHTMRRAAVELGHDMTWGGAWDTVFTDSHIPPEQLMQRFIVRRRVARQPVFLDGPHYQLLRGMYPDAPDS